MCDKKRPIVKICGLRRGEDLRVCIQHGADILGFVVDYPHQNPWNLTVGEAKKLMAAASPAKSCVVTGGTAEHVLSLAAELRPDYMQYHWEATAPQVKYLAGALEPFGVKLIQAVFPHTPDLPQTAAAFAAAGAHALLLDSRTPEHAQHSGAASIAAWQKLQPAVNCPVILAGGITPDNAAALVRSSDVAMIDLMTGVELAPGVKDKEKVAALFRALRQ